ncbi:YfgM family protein [Aeromonas media]|uniref:Ancillary SecYEG translocon subunit n=1 Tax=Aeromonas media TaxID=651 RepID=A0AAE7AGS8_AERME|nr:tetratricopeptide repeat protein [Aeromonas media]MBP8112331.1 tetratricopeptide repeat protein [Aeromonas sp.]MBP9678556.1 tetratricopeptide repeat protein [Aeromonas sp.]MBS4639949.1 tetratricopeptide repeat protein [Aeromonas media]MCV3288525.1 tetratricopeptide repeat protein [Aeromonas media]QJT30355.1 tetratricopeptide repeat protein [Aeromonas media]
MEVYTTEEQQVEVIKSWWKENGTSVLAGTVIGLVGLFGWRYYNELQQTNQEAASQAYNAMTAQLAKGDDAALEQAKSFISAHQGDAYAELAALQLAAAAVKAGKLDLAAEQLTLVAASGDESIKPIAALRLARVLKDQGKADEALAQLGKINNDAFKAQVAEVRGDVLLGQGKPEEARDAYQVAADAGGLQSSAELKLKMDDLALPAVTAGEAPDA